MFKGHHPYLVALSVLIAILGGYTGFGLATRIRSRPGASHRLLLADADAVYLILPTVVSFPTCVLAVGISLFFVSIDAPSLPRWHPLCEKPVSE